MSSLQELFFLAIEGGLILLVLAIGLDATLEDATYLLRHPLLLLRTFLSINVLVPLFAVVLTLVWHLEPVVKIGIVLMAIAPFPPFVPGQGLKLGARKEYIYGLLTAMALLSIVVVPITVTLLNIAFPHHASISPSAVAKSVLTLVIIPLGVGILIQYFSPTLANRIRPLVSKLANPLLIIGIIPVLIEVWPAIWHLIGNGAVLAISAVVAFGLAVGHWLGGPNLHDRSMLAVSSATRHPGIALLIADANLADPKVKATILLFVLVGLIVSGIYQSWFRRHAKSQEAASGTAK